MTIRVCSSLVQKVGDSAQIEVQKDGKTLELTGLDEFSTKDEVCEALNVELGNDNDVLTVETMQKVYRGTPTAIVRLPINIAR